SWGSLGHERPGRFKIHSVINNKIPEIKNIQNLYSVKVINHGREKEIAAIAAPKPRMTKIIGRVQHNKVPVEVTKHSQTRHCSFASRSINISYILWQEPQS